MSVSWNPAQAGHREPRPGSGGLVVVGPEVLTADQIARLQRIYEQAFPPHLRVPLAELAADSPRDRLLVALDGGDAVGFAALRLLSAPRWAFLRYFGVAADRRRTGLGLRFWQLLTQAVTDLGWPASIALEAEDPAHAASDPAEQQVRLGRIGFWTRCGASPLPVTGYMMPALTDIGHSEPMVLMAFDPGAGSPSPADVANLVRAIFTEHYGLTGRHPIVLAALESIGTGAG
jgi:GNAT superfamily N-acetyltransferase